MVKSIISIARCLAVATTAMLSVSVAAPAVAAPIRIMPLGDSITQGGKGPSLPSSAGATVGYRYHLYFDHLAAGYDVDFVGSVTGVNNGVPDAQDYPNYNSTFDRQNEGHWGRPASFLNSNMTAYMNAALPDIILLHAGTNDLRDIGMPYTLQGILNTLGGIIDKAQAVNPDVAIFVSTISNSVTPSRCNQLNAALPGLVASKHTATSQVVLVDMVGNGFSHTAGVHTYDGTHPNLAGERFMSDQWFLAMLAAGVLVPEPSTLAILLVGGSVAALLLRRRPRPFVGMGIAHR